MKNRRYVTLEVKYIDNANLLMFVHELIENDISILDEFGSNIHHFFDILHDYLNQDFSKLQLNEIDRDQIKRAIARAREVIELLEILEKEAH